MQNEKHVHVHEFLKFGPDDVHPSLANHVKRRTHRSELRRLDRMRQTRVQRRLLVLAEPRGNIRSMPFRRHHLFKCMFLTSHRATLSLLETLAHTTYRSSILESHRAQILFPIVVTQCLNSAREGHVSRLARAPRTLEIPWIERGSVGDMEGNMTVGSRRISAYGYPGVNLVSACTLALNVIVLSISKGRGNEWHTKRCNCQSVPYRRCCDLGNVATTERRAGRQPCPWLLVGWINEYRGCDGFL
jgi:hypothetical protein